MEYEIMVESYGVGMIIRISPLLFWFYDLERGIYLARLVLGLLSSPPQPGDSGSYSVYTNNFGRPRLGSILAVLISLLFWLLENEIKKNQGKKHHNNPLYMYVKT
jgi:hypothetical protein